MTTTTLTAALAGALWGAACGLLLPRLVYRLTPPDGGAWRQACPSGHPLAGLGRGWLGPARCPDCPRVGARFAPHAWAWAGACAVLCALAAEHAVSEELVGAVWLGVAPIGLVLAVVDARTHRLPNPLTYTLAPALIAALAVVALVDGDWPTWQRALSGGLALGLLYAAASLFLPASVGPPGMGDAKLVLSVGLLTGWHGWGTLLGTLILAHLLLSAHAVFAAVHRGRDAMVPYAPALLSALAVTTLLPSP